MRKAISTLLLVLAFAAVSAAQQGATNNTGNDNKKELKTVEGCLTKSGDTYVITGGGPGPKQFRIISGDTSMLKGKQEQTVRVFGMVGHSSPVQDVAPPYGPGSTTGVGYDTIEAQNIEIVYGNCSEPGKEWPGVHK